MKDVPDRENRKYKVAQKEDTQPVQGTAKKAK